jgi:hypothetical protein
LPFKASDVSRLLADCHRRCCICHRFCGVKIEIHHIEPVADGGADSADNAIPVCFECHAEIQLYNDRHPRGRKFRPDELRLHRDQWLGICRESPGDLLVPARSQGIGPIQALVDELEFNAVIAGRTNPQELGALFLTTQFDRAIAEGVFALLHDDLRGRIAAVYATLMKANADLTSMASFAWGGPSGTSKQHAQSSATKAIESIHAELNA